MDKSQIIELLSDSSKNALLFHQADMLRRQNVGDEVHLRGLIEFSNICKCSCLYCGLRCENKTLERYRMPDDEIISSAKLAVSLGYKTIVLQSGEDSYFDTDKICFLIREIKKLDVALTLSLGERTFEEYKAFRLSGADRYLMRIETSNRVLYGAMHPSASFDNRLRCLEDIKTLGYETGTGCLVGLPNQTIESLAEDILFFKELNADMVGIGPFIPHPQTPLKDENKDNFELSLKVMAVVRLILPDINIPATTAMETLNPNGRLIALQSGANVVMPNITPQKYRKNYEIYPGKICLNDSPTRCRSCIEAKIKSIGRSIANTYGFRRDR